MAFALLDGNDFYCSCERLFRPSLRGIPLVVLSSNDGCVVARSLEARALGIKMGQPYFEVRHFANTHGLLALSANFALYADVSARVMSVAAGLSPDQELYSIDEAFHNMRHVSGDHTERARRVRSRILQWVGIPCGVGLGPTKTLAKLANHIAKSAERKPGSYPAHHAQVCNLNTLDRTELQALLQATEVGDVWGVGRRIGAQLRDAGVHTAWDLSQMDLGLVRRRWSVVLERTVRELRGQSCISLEDCTAPKREIAVTQSFGAPVRSAAELVEAVSEFAGRAAFKLRRQGGYAGRVLVFARTSPFRDGPRFERSLLVPLVAPSADTRVIVSAAVMAAKAMFSPGYDLAKAGVMLLELQDGPPAQQALDLGCSMPDRSALMGAVDAINRRYGADTVHVATAGVTTKQRAWEAKHARRTPRYTTRWSELPEAY